MTRIVSNAFGVALKEWRGKRRLSQLDLGLAANVSTRHISFLETGRARPSRPMVLLLSEQLGLPFDARNAILGAAGFAPAFRSRPMDGEDMAPVRAAVDRMLLRHDPYPAYALDREWTIVTANGTAQRLFSNVGIGAGSNLLDALLNEDGLGGTLENWEEVARLVVARLRTESAHLGGNPVLDRAIRLFADRLDAMPSRIEQPLAAVIPTRYRAGETVLSFFSTIAQFGTATDIALAELRIELLFPSDAATGTALEQLASAHGAG